MKKKIDKNIHYRNITLSTRVSAAQKAEFVKIAESHGVSPSEWMLTIIETNKHSYGKANDPTPNEIKQKRENELLKKQLQKTIVQRDTSDEYAANMLDRSNKAVRDRDDSNYAMKVALVEKEKFKRRLNAIESLMGREKSKETESDSLITPVSIGLGSILAIIFFGNKFR
jgi:MoaA/NifB/PqqE/SkfB family radical SAM enzyme